MLRLGSIALLAVAACTGKIGGSISADGSASADAAAIRDADPVFDDAIALDAPAPPDDALPLDAIDFDSGVSDLGPGALDAFDLDAPLADAVVAPDGGVPGDCTNARLCESFESYATGAPPGAPWDVSVNAATIVVDETHAFRGQRSVKFTTNGGTGTYRRAFIGITGAPVFPVPGNVVWGRMMIWLTAAPTADVHWTNIQGEGAVSGMTFRALSRYGGQHQKRLMANYETQGVGSDCWQHSATAIPEGRWACMEWRFNGPNDEMDFWLDGAALSDLTVVGQGSGCISNGTGGHWYSPQYDTIRVGWEHYQQSIAHELWIDDVAIDGARIGCP